MVRRRHPRSGELDRLIRQARRREVFRWPVPAVRRDGEIDGPAWIWQMRRALRLAILRLAEGDGFPPDWEALIIRRRGGTPALRVFRVSQWPLYFHAPRLRMAVPGPEGGAA
jgi:hypothetical protein